jgi:hydrogenase maturation protease
MRDKDSVQGEWEEKQEGRILIAGLGNLLLQDDGIGVHAVKELQKQEPPLPGVLAVEVGVAVLDALHLFERADKILAIDAMQAGGSPGTIYSFRVSDVKEQGCQTSLHELSLLAALRFLPQSVNPEILILGMEPETINYGLELSPAGQAALPQLVQAAREIVTAWREKTRCLDHAR